MPACMCCNVRRASAGGAVQVPERHQQPTGRARLAPQQSQEVHRRQEPRPGLRTGRTGVSKVCLVYPLCPDDMLFFFSFFVSNPPLTLSISVCVPLPSELLCLAPPGAEGVLQAAVRPPLPGTQSNRFSTAFCHPPPTGAVIWNFITHVYKHIDNVFVWWSYSKEWQINNMSQSIEQLFRCLLAILK